MVVLKGLGIPRAPGLIRLGFDSHSLRFTHYKYTYSPIVGSTMARHRSRAHPSIPLGEGIEKAESLYQAERFNWIPVKVALEHWGYKSDSSHGMRVVAALLQYGLIEDEGSGDHRRIRLSELARDILHHPNSSVRKEKLQDSALMPTLHREIWETYEKIPSDANLRYELTKSGDLNENAVDSFIANFRETLSFAGLSKSESSNDALNGADHTEEFSESENIRHSPSREEERGAGALPKTSSRPYDLSLLLPTGEIAILRMPSKQTPKTFRYLKKALTMNLELLEEALTQNENDDDSELSSRKDANG